MPHYIIEQRGEYRQAYRIWGDTSSIAQLMAAEHQLVRALSKYQQIFPLWVIFDVLINSIFPGILMCLALCSVAH